MTTAKEYHGLPDLLGMGIEGIRIEETGEGSRYKYYALFTGDIGGGSGTINGETVEELETKLTEFYSGKLIEQKNNFQKKANDLEELALRIKEFGWEKTSQHYQALQIENKDGGNK
jgi:hypothetical protein